MRVLVLCAVYLAIFAERRAVRVVRRRRARWPLFGLRLSILGGQVVALSDPAAMRLVLPAQEAGD